MINLIIFKSFFFLCLEILIFCVSPSQFLFLNNELIKNNVISILYSLSGDGHVDCGFGTLWVIKVKIVFLNQNFYSNY